jgi:gliding motility-associated-like protein
MNRIDFTEKVFSDNRNSRDAFRFPPSAFYLLFSVFCLFCTLSLQAQTADTRGTDFWLTFGRNHGENTHQILDFEDRLSLQIRIVAGEYNVTGRIDFTELNTFVSFSLRAGQTYTYNLTKTQKKAVYNSYGSGETAAGNTSGRSYRTAHVTTDKPVTVYALNMAHNTTDATNILPVTTLGTDYYQISYTVYSQPEKSPGITNIDAYAVIATQNDTRIYHNNALIYTLSKGEVYYRVSTTDMTGSHITSDKPVAFFVLQQAALVPGPALASEHLFQQLAPVHTWGKTFFVPASQLKKDRVRIVASQNNTNITQQGGTRVGGQPTLTNLNAGQWVELEITFVNKGCYIQSNKPVGVCAYLTSGDYNGTGGDPSQCWIPSLEQSLKSALMSPFKPVGSSVINRHLALIITPTATRNNTKIKVGSREEVDIFAGIWYENTNGNMSYYNMIIVEPDSSLLFINDAGMIVFCYGLGESESYYYLASSSMRVLDVAFYVNDIHFQNIASEICKQPVQFRAEIEYPLSTVTGFLKWFIDDVEEVAVRDQFNWEKTFGTGVYKIKMETRLSNGTTKIAETTITIINPILNPIADVNLCAGETVPAISFTGVNVDTLYWKVTAGSGTAIGMSANNGKGTIPSFVAKNSGTTPVITGITVTPKSASGCEGESKTFTVTVNPLPALNDIKDIIRCAGETVPVISFAGTNVDTVIWVVTDGTTIGMLANNGKGSIPSFTAIHSGSVTVTATPKSASGCKGESKTFTITVNPLPVLNPQGNLTLCAGEASGLIVFSGTGVDSVRWSVTAGSGTSIGMSSNNGKGSIPSFMATNTGTADISVTITVIPKFANGCEGAAMTFTITVKPLPVLDAIPHFAFCAGETVPLIPFTGVHIDTVSWVTTNGTAIGMNNTGKGDISGFTATNSTVNPLVATITVTPKSAAGCMGATKTFTVKVNPLPMLNPIQDINICNGETVPTISFTGTNIDTVTWTAVDGATLGMSLSSGMGNIPGFVTTNTTSNPLSAIITATPKSAANCEGISQIFTITVYHQEPIEINIGNDTVICKLDSLLLDADHPNAASYQWQDGYTGATYTFYRNEEGQYWVIARNQCSEARDAIDISYYKDLKQVNLGKDRIFCPDDVIYIELNVTTPGASSYVWQDNSNLPTYLIEQPGTYSVTVSNICMSVSNTVEVSIKDCNILEIWLPNAFTPNENVMNDVFKPVVNNPELLKEYELTVYDRWGKLVFITQDYLSGWNGKDHKNKDCSEGVYAGVIKYKSVENKEFIKKFSITLIR